MFLVCFLTYNTQYLEILPYKVDMPMVLASVIDGKYKKSTATKTTIIIIIERFLKLHN